MSYREQREPGSLSWIKILTLESITQANNNLQAEIYEVNVQVQSWHIEKKSITHHTP